MNTAHLSPIIPFGIRRFFPLIRPVLLTVLTLACILARRADALNLERLHSFELGQRRPASKLILGTDGNYYGTTTEGGAFNAGTVFRMTPAGVVTKLAEFTGGGANNSGRRPQGALVQGRDGNFYGTTLHGGYADLGTVFKMTPEGVLTTLVEFTYSGQFLPGAFPEAGLVEGSDGNFYGTTSQGGAGYGGTAFRMTPDGALTTLNQFGVYVGGFYPRAALIAGRDGNFYGTTEAGGSWNLGTVFRMTPTGDVTTLVEFTGDVAPVKGGRPKSELVQGVDGNFYGTTSRGGTADKGTVFRMTPTGTLVTLVEFTGNAATGNGAIPAAGLTLGIGGNFFGTTVNGGTGDFGTVFKVTPAGVLTTLVQFGNNGPGVKGARPSASLLRGADGSFLGTTMGGGVDDSGTVFRVTPAGTFATLAEFREGGSPDGSGIYPEAGLLQTADGSLLGTTVKGGASGLGTVFSISRHRTITTLVEFTGTGGTSRGARPRCVLVPGLDGNYYGTTPEGGTNNRGTIFRMTPAGALTTLVDFTGNGATNKGANPQAGLLWGADGFFYGTTERGGAGDFGTVFRMTPAGVLTTLVEFTQNGTVNKGRHPRCPLIRATDGNFYGTTVQGGPGDFGTIFRMTPGGALTTLVEFASNSPINTGAYPQAGLMQAADGNFYGTTGGGGVNYRGTVFRMTPDGTFTNLTSFAEGSGARYGTLPRSILAQGGDGTLYGTTAFSGHLDCGAIFTIAPGGALGALFNFAPTPFLRGARPFTGVVRGADNHLYGTTREGGAGGGGVVYRLRFGPSPVLDEAVAVTSSTATLQGRVNPRGFPTNVSFEYGLSPTLADAVSVSAGTLPAGTALVDVSVPISGLTPQKRYYFRLVAQNAENALPARTGLHSFKTLP